MNFEKCLLKTALILLFCFMLTLNVYCKGTYKIPSNPDFFSFTTKFYIYEYNQHEIITYAKKANAIVATVEFRRINKKGEKVDFKRKEEIDFLTTRNSEIELVKYLNYIDFMKIPNTIGNRCIENKKVKNKIVFQIFYKHNGKTYKKKIVVYNINSQLKDSKNDYAFKLKFLMLYFNELEYLIYQLPKNS